jgi:putative ATP-dependent endonuclease of the OLD family
VGENNAGKTNILRALKTVLEKDWLNVRDFLPEDRHRHDESKDIEIEVEFDPPLVYQGFASEEPVSIPVLRYMLTRYKRATKSARAGDPRLLQEPLGSDGEAVQILREAPRKGEQRKYKPLTHVPSEVKSQAPLIYIGPERHLSDQLPSARYSLLRRLLEDVVASLQDALIEDESGTKVPLTERFETLLEEALSVLRVDEFVELESLIRQHALENLGFDPEDRERFALRLGLFGPIEFFKALRLIVDEYELEMDAMDLGHGAQNAITIAIFQAYEKLKRAGAVFLIEEPELHLHPHRCRYFYETLRRVSATNQVIYTTHSPHFVTVPYFDEVRLVYRSAGGDTAMVEPNVEVTPSTREKLTKELDPERNELFFARHVLLVEGDTEKLALPEYARRLGFDLNRHGVSVVEVGGKRSLDLFIEVIKAMELEQTVIFDEDSSDFKGQDKEKEEQYNKEILSRASDSTHIHMLRPKYEAELRQSLGEGEYQAACQAYPKITPAIRARLIAMDPKYDVPDFAKDILRDLGWND